MKKSEARRQLEIGVKQYNDGLLTDKEYIELLFLLLCRLLCNGWNTKLGAP